MKGSKKIHTYSNYPPQPHQKSNGTPLKSGKKHFFITSYHTSSVALCSFVFFSHITRFPQLFSNVDCIDCFAELWITKLV